MATVQAFQVSGLKMWFWSNDHEPPHFHAKRSGEWEVKVSFMLEPDNMIEIKWSEKDVPANVSPIILWTRYRKTGGELLDLDLLEATLTQALSQLVG